MDNRSPISVLWMTVVSIAVFGIAGTMGSCSGNGQKAANAKVMAHQEATSEIGIVLDTLHDAAAKADGTRYWSCFAPDAVFLGTDATERWTLTEFRKYADERFATGKGWNYVASNRHVTLSPGKDAAWFDEVVTNAKYGACRGTGVMVKTREGWKIAQYSLTLPIPNDLMAEISSLIKGYLKDRREDK
jgi:hypothetical protein